MATKTIILEGFEISSTKTQYTGWSVGTVTRNFDFQISKPLTSVVVSFHAGQALGTMMVNGIAASLNNDNTITLDNDATSASWTFQSAGSVSGTVTRKLNVTNISVTATWEEDTQPVPPENVTLDTMSAYAGGDVTMTWSGADPGSFNVKRYDIQWMDSIDGIFHSDWSFDVVSVESTATRGSAVVKAGPTVGEYRKYRIRLVCAAGDGTDRNSAWR